MFGSSSVWMGWSRPRTGTHDINVACLQLKKAHHELCSQSDNSAPHEASHWKAIPPHTAACLPISRTMQSSRGCRSPFSNPSTEAFSNSFSATSGLRWRGLEDAAQDFVSTSNSLMVKVSKEELPQSCRLFLEELVHDV